LVFLLIPYYLSVLLQNEILAFIRNPAIRQEPFNTPRILPAASSADDISLSVIHELLEDLKKVFTVALKTKMVKEELVQAIHSN
jgi:hypothetical protein